MLPTMLEHDRRRSGWSVEQAAWRLGVTICEYRETRGRRPLTELRGVAPDLQSVRLAPDVRGYGLSMRDPFDEDADIRSDLAALGPPALAELRRILEAPSPYRTQVLQALMARTTSSDLATLIAMADTDEVVRLRLLRAIRDLGV